MCNAIWITAATSTRGGPAPPRRRGHVDGRPSCKTFPSALLAIAARRHRASWRHSCPSDGSGPHAPLRFEAIDEVFAALRAGGHRISSACRLVVEALFASEDPASAQQLARRAGMPESDLSSVYRNLERLEELGVVRHVHLGHGAGLYLLVGSGEREFLLCERCGRVRSVAPTELDPIREQIERSFGYCAHFDHFPIVGTCADCRPLR